MAVLDILIYPDSRLRQVAQPVTKFDNNLNGLVHDMAETMYNAAGIGLAAIQVNVKQRVVVIDISEEKDQLQVFVNPKITVQTGSVEFEEGCLSVPEYTSLVERAEQILLKAQDTCGNNFGLEVDGLLAICLQHEVDHLEGIIFVDYLSRLKRERIHKKLIKEARQDAPVTT